MTALKLSNYPRVLEYLDVPTNKVMATVIIQSTMKNGTYFSISNMVEALFELIKGLIKDSDGIPSDEIEHESQRLKLMQLMYLCTFVSKVGQTNASPDLLPFVQFSLSSHANSVCQIVLCRFHVEV
ncbi:hypothetical protein TanjilG_00445 [Lupinus angustifolius]|uniref:Uncharacterized protein n=1 Tax=Lupinus angustifolius TaxID=3871 RepID=A0A394D975_LUPAN|nr:hypothetical protein TanjilG_00445 [Lupinus angustifolius]